MKNLAYVAPLLAIAITACGDEPSEPKSIDEVIEAASGMTQPLPGQYRSTTEMVSLEIPGAPEGMAERMKGMMGGQFTQTTTSCLTEEEASQGFEQQFRQLGEGMNGMKCDFDKFDVDGDDVDARMTCSGPQNLTATMEMEGTTGAERQTVDMNMQMRTSQIPGGEMNVALKVLTERVGDCT
ncbi:MAG: DUF3617 domain-containing protein [Alteripontixanthobacter sp.]